MKILKKQKWSPKNIVKVGDGRGWRMGSNQDPEQNSQ